MDSESEKSWPGRLGIAIPVNDDDVYVFFLTMGGDDD